MNGETSRRNRLDRHGPPRLRKLLIAHDVDPSSVTVVGDDSASWLRQLTTVVFLVGQSIRLSVSKVKPNHEARIGEIVGKGL